VPRHPHTHLSAQTAFFTDDYLIHVAGHNLGLLMRLLIGAGTPKEAVARGWCVLILLPISDGAADAAILIVLLAHSAIPALIVVNMRLDRRPD
jgi:hypothetical protein